MGRGCLRGRGRLLPFPALRNGAYRALSPVDLLICATAAQHDLVVLHDDNDFTTAARYLPDLREHNIRDTPKTD